MTDIRSTDRIRELEGDFQRRFEPNFAWSNALSAAMNLPGIRALVPFSATASTTTIANLAGAGNFTINNNAQIGYDRLAPCGIVPGVNQYWSAADAAQWDILGTEAYIASPGLTIGAWVNPASIANAFAGIVVKWVTGGNQRAYRIMRVTAGVMDYRFDISVDGVNTALVQALAANTGYTLINRWYFVVGRFTPGVEMKIWACSTTQFYAATLAAGVPASIFNSTAPLELGAINAANLWNGKLSYAFVCAAACSDAQIQALWEQTRAMYHIA